MVDWQANKTIDRKNDIKILTGIISVFLFVVWLCTPPGNKFAQICLYGNNTQFFIAKLTKSKEELNEWIYHRNNAVYRARMEQKKEALEEIDMAIATAPLYLSDAEMSKLYADSAQIKLYFKEYKSALNDYLRVKTPDAIESFKIALLYKEIGQNRYALQYCNNILQIDANAYVGYACIADVYAGVGRYDVSVRVYDLLIDRVHNRARYYADRAGYRKQLGDLEGYKDDVNKAKELSPLIDLEGSIVKETLQPKSVLLQIM